MKTYEFNFDMKYSITVNARGKTKAEAKENAWKKIQRKLKRSAFNINDTGWR